MEKFYKRLLMLIKICLFLYAILTGVRCFIDADYNKWGGFLAGLILPFGPDLIEKVFRINIRPRIVLLYYIFVFVALDMGICMDLYRTAPGFDKAVHLLSGVCSGILAYYMLVYYHVDTARRNFRILFTTCFSLGVGVLWEFFEFGCDKLLGQSMQQLISVGVDDTMFDLISAFIGSFIGGLLIAMPAFRAYIEEDWQHHEMIATVRETIQNIREDGLMDANTPTTHPEPIEVRSKVKKKSSQKSKKVH